MRTRFRRKTSADPMHHIPRNTNFTSGGGNALFLSRKSPRKKRTAPNPKNDIQKIGTTNLAGNVHADDKSHSATGAPFQDSAFRLLLCPSDLAESLILIPKRCKADVNQAGAVT